MRDPRQIGNRAATHEERLRRNLYIDAHAPGVDPSRFVSQLAQAVEERIWEQLSDIEGHPLDFRSFLEAPHPVGLGVSAEVVKTLLALPQRQEALPDHVATARRLREAVERLLLEPLGTHGGARVGQPAISRSPPPVAGGSGRAYTLRRLARDAPELAEAVLQGRLSANAAAIAAGIRRRPTPLEAMRRAWARLSERERQEFLVDICAAYPNVDDRRS